MPNRRNQAGLPSADEQGVLNAMKEISTAEVLDGKKRAKPSSFVKPLAGLSATMLYLAQSGNDRLTINQAAFFLIAAAADARGRPMTVSEIMEGAEGILNPSLQNTYKVLLEPNRRDYKDIGLGWLEREPDPDDERRRYLRVTDKGWNVVRAALLALGHAVEDVQEVLS